MNDAAPPLRPADTDITSLREAEARLHALTDAAHDAILIMDPAGRISYWNPAATQILGYTAAEALGQDLHRLLAPERYRDAHAAAFPEFQRKGTGAAVDGTLELAARRKDGTEITVELSLSGLALPDGWHALGILRDVSARKRLEAELKASEARFRLLFEQHLTVMLLIEPTTGRILDANEAAAEFYGYSRDRLRTMSIAEINCLPPSRITAERMRATRQTKSRFLFPHRLADGTIRTVEVHAAPITLDERPLLFSIIHDVTARERAEERLRVSEERHRLLADQSLDVIWTMDLDGRITYVSPSVERMRGYTPEEVMRQSIEDILTPESCARVRQGLESARTAVMAGRPMEPFRAELTERRRDGSLIWVEVSATALSDPQGNFVELLGVSRDITERKRMEEQLRRSEERYRQAVEATSEGLWDVDLATGTVVTNERAAAVLGYAPGEAGDSIAFWEQCLHPDDAPAVRRAQDDYLSGRTPVYEVEHRIVTPAGEVRWLRTVGTIVARAADGTPLRMVGTNADITQQRTQAEALRAAKAAAEAASAAKSEFLAHMSHELRTPLNGVLGLAQVLAREPLAPQQRDMVARIEAAGRSLLTIINDVLDLAKIEAGRLRIESRPFDPGALLSRLECLMGPTARDKGLGFEVDGPAEPLGLLVGDGQRLEQVLLNLTGNAIKFTEHGKVAVRAQTVAEDGGTLWLRFAVSDTGIGIAPETLGRLFTAFSQADGSITRRFGGTGLGLSICKRLVELMGGEIGVLSRVEEGSSFWFELPFTRAGAQDPAAATAPDRRPAAPRLSGAHFLVVDDSPMNRDLVERALALEGASVTPATDGRQAIEALRARPAAFDAVLMDIRMPVMDGLTATRQIRGTLGLDRLPIIALTAGVMAEEQDAAHAAGIDDVLPKPLDLDRMVALLARRIGPGRAGQAADAAPVPPAHTAPVRPDAALPELPGIDIAALSAPLRQDRAWYLRLLTGLTDEFAEAPAATRRDLATGAREAAARRMHTLRGNAGTLGALNLMSTAAALEAAIAAGETDLAAGLDGLARQLAELTAGLARARAAVAPARTPSPTAATAAPPDAGQLAALCAALRAQDLNALRRFEDLRPRLAAAWGETRTAALGRAILGLRFAEALAELESGSDRDEQP